MKETLKNDLVHLYHLTVKSTLTASESIPFFRRGNHTPRSTDGKSSLFYSALHPCAAISEGVSPTVHDRLILIPVYML